jgi:hypothetical protein
VAEEMQSSHPTGSVSTNLPFWEELDDKHFEEFCTAFLNLNPVIHCHRGGKVVGVKILSALRQLTGQPQFGADILAKAEKGEQWLFQCKRVQGLGPAQLDEAARLAEVGSPMMDQYVLVVTCGLRTDAQRGVVGRPKWLIWDASRLTTETQRLGVRDGMSLVRRFFGKDRAKQLFPSSDQPLQTWGDFFERDLSADRVYFHHRVEYVPIRGVLEELENFARTGAGKALVLSAAGGQGKSRLLLELARRLEGPPKPVAVRFLNPGRSGLTEEQTDLLGREEQDLLLIVDDAHRLDAALGDVARAATRAKRVRLLVATRPHALEAVSNLLYRNGYEERMEKPVRMRAWGLEDIHRLAQHVLRPDKRWQAAHLMGLADKCPLLVVIGGGLINAGALPGVIADHETFRQRVFTGFKKDILERQPAANRERMDRLIRFLSLVSPAPGKELLSNKLAEIIGCTPTDVAEDLEALKVAGLVVENREGARLYPDLFADAVLLDASLDSSREASFFIQTALAKLSFTDFPALMRNVAQADWEARSRRGAQGSLFAPIWREFVRRFEQSDWRAPNENLSRFVQSTFNENPAPKPQDRDDLLNAWAAFAIYLPERTLEVAQMAVSSVEAPSGPPTPKSVDKPAIRPDLSILLTPLLLPIATWHPTHADEALDMLWSLDADQPVANRLPTSNPISAIADAGRFAAHKPLSSSESVIRWLEGKLQDPRAVERLREQPWLLSALLKPFFARLVESSWTTERAVTFSISPVAVEATRRIRKRALALAERFLCSADEVLASAAVPVLGEAIRKMHGRFRFEPTPKDHALWQADRLEALSVLQRAIAAQSKSPLLLFQIRRLLLGCAEYDPDAAVVERCKQLLAEVPDSFDLRVARALGSWAHDEIKVQPGPNSLPEAKEAKRRWDAFCREVAREASNRHPDARAFCAFLARWVKALAASGFPAQAHVVIEPVAALSETWSGALLDELVNSSDATLDGFLWAALLRAKSDAPEHYLKALEGLFARGRPSQVCSLVRFLGAQGMQGSGLDHVERDALRALVRRTDEDVVCEIATALGLQFSKEPAWALELLCGLKPQGKRGLVAILEALARLAQEHAAELDGGLMAKCLRNLGDYPAEHIDDDHDLQVLAEKFPKQLYECLRGILDEAHGGSPALAVAQIFSGRIPFARIEDHSYVAREVQTQWAKALAGGPGVGERLFLAHSLIGSMPEAAPSLLARFIKESATTEELKLATRLAAPQGSDFVFRFPDLVRELLTRSQVLGVGKEVQQALWLAACGGPGGYTNGHLDPESRYICERAEDLANRYAGDPALASFYRGISQSERIDQKELQRRWEEDEEES